MGQVYKKPKPMYILWLHLHIVLVTPCWKPAQLWEIFEKYVVARLFKAASQW